jgi:hypothetical protein
MDSQQHKLAATHDPTDWVEILRSGGTSKRTWRKKKPAGTLPTNKTKPIKPQHEYKAWW